MTGSLGAFLRDLCEASDRRLWSTLALSILCSLSEGAGLALIIPTLAVAGFNFGSQGGADRYAAIVRSALARLGLKPGLLTLLAILIALIGARAIPIVAATFRYGPCSRSSRMSCGAASIGLSPTPTGCSLHAAASPTSATR